jgi:hypothetical protein
MRSSDRDADLEADDTILFTPVIGPGIMRVQPAVTTGTVTTLTADIRINGRNCCPAAGCCSAPSGPADAIYARRSDGQQHRLAGLGARYLPSGHLVFIQGGTVMAVPLIIDMS